MASAGEPGVILTAKNSDMQGGDGANVLVAEVRADCTVCRQIGAKACSKCGLDSYCSKKHQKEDWPRHKAMVCSASPEDKRRLRQRLWQVDVNDDAMDPVGAGTETKAQAVRLMAERGARRLLTVICCNDRAWAERLLRAAAPLVEELELWDAQPEHWALLADMPRLYRLEVNTYVDFSPGGLKALPPLPAAPDAPGRGLQWLRTCLSEDSTVALVGAHARTLRELQLFVGTDTTDVPDPLVPTRPRWPWKCSAAALAGVVSRCGALPALRRVVLRRPSRPVMTLGGDFAHCARECRQQLAALRAHVPAEARLLCGTCHNVQWGCFEYTICGLW